MDKHADQIKCSFLNYLLSLDYDSAQDKQSLLYDLYCVVEDGEKVSNDPQYNQIMKWGEGVIDKVNRGLA